MSTPIEDLAKRKAEILESLSEVVADINNEGLEHQVEWLKDLLAKVEESAEGLGRAPGLRHYGARSSKHRLPVHPPASDPLMRIYIVLMHEVYTQGYKVRAHSPEEAFSLVFKGQGQLLESLFEYSHTLPSATWLNRRVIALFQRDL
jgi:hypothetical protein